MKSHSRPRSPRSLDILTPRITIHVLPPPRGTPDAIKVIARFRPFTAQELDYDAASPMTCSIECDSIVQVGPLEQNKFVMDKVFDPDATQEEVFACIGNPIIEDVITGYNGTVLAYGQTGSGKTYTMMGQEDGSNDGLVPRAAHQIFETILASDPEIVFTIKCSMMEIYKETLKDLLYPSEAKLTIKESGNGIFIDGLSEDYIGDEEELMEKIAYGQQNRTVASTKLNSHSSRSHQLFVLTVKQTLPDGMEKTGILNLVDLAGSEKVNISGVTGNKLEEAKKINLSLSMLGHVIHSLSSGASHIPYRDSKLTRILQESLGGNFKTCLVVACSPHIRNLEETLSTLRFAQRAKTIKNKVVLNVKETSEAVIARLTKQLAEAYSYIEKLKKRDANQSIDLSPQLKGSWGTPVSGDEEEARSFISYPESESGKPFDQQKTWETLMSQHEADLTTVKSQKKELEAEVAYLKRKLKNAKREKVNCERTLMDMAGKSKQLTDRQVYLIEDMAKDGKILQLEKEVKTLKMKLRDAHLSRERSSQCVEMEEELSLESEPEDHSSDSSDSEESERSSCTIHHMIPIDLEGVITKPRWSTSSDQPLPSDGFTLRNQVLQ